MAKSPLYGLMAEFETPEQVLDAALRTRAEGYHHMDTYTPFAVEGLPEIVVTRHKVKLPAIVLCGGLTGTLTGLILEWFPNSVGYPLDIGGKPNFSWPAFIPIMFELTILFAALSAVFGMIILNDLPQPYHPVFNAPRFDLASRDRFFLCIETRDPKFDLDATKDFLIGLNPVDVTEVES
jgi:Protein of unknown function (DUF3341)